MTHVDRVRDLVATVKCMQNDFDRPILVTVVRWSLMVIIFLYFVLNVILAFNGSGAVDDYFGAYKDEEEIECLKAVWMVFVSMNIVFSVTGFIGVVIESICCVFMFAIYML